LKKKILIIGPFGRKGGRDLEVAFIAKTLQITHNITLFSTVNVNPIGDLQAFGYKEDLGSLNELVYKNHLGIRVATNLMYFFRKKIRANYFHISNRLTNTLFSLDLIKAKQLELFLAHFDGVLICAQLHSKYMESIVESAIKHHIPVLFRTTGTIELDKIERKDWLQNVTYFIHHSHNNANKLTTLIDQKYARIDQCAFQENTLLKIPLPSEKINHFLCLGRLDENKNIATVIAAFKKCNLKDATLTIVGDGEEKRNLKDFAEPDSRISFLNFVSNQELATVFKNIDCLIIASKKESGPITAVEAMAAGRLVLSTRVGAMPERLPDYPFWFNGSPEDLGAQLLTLNALDTSVVSKYALRLRNDYKENFSKEGIGNQYGALVASIV